MFIEYIALACFPPFFFFFYMLTFLKGNQGTGSEIENSLLCFCVAYVPVEYSET